MQSELSGPSRFFPESKRIESDGGFYWLGGSLSPEWLLDAYSHGIFPWPDAERPYFGVTDYLRCVQRLERRAKIFPRGEADASDGQNLMQWCSPDPRAIFDLDRIHVPKRLKTTLRSGRFTFARDRAFDAVLLGCALASGRNREGSWITPGMYLAYTRMHRLNFTHSFEAWQGDRLVGGVYGIAIRGLFAAESMFYLEPDASKVALVYMLDHLRECGFTLLDIQMLTPNTERFGAFEISHTEYMERLASAMKCEDKWRP